MNYYDFIKTHTFSRYSIAGKLCDETEKIIKEHVELTQSTEEVDEAMKTLYRTSRTFFVDIELEISDEKPPEFNWPKITLDEYRRLLNKLPRELRKIIERILEGATEDNWLDRIREDKLEDAWRKYYDNNRPQENRRQYTGDHIASEDIEDRIKGRIMGPILGPIVGAIKLPAGIYVHKEKKIILFSSTLGDPDDPRREDAYLDVFVHELFHAFHYNLADIYEMAWPNRNQTKNICYEVIEGLAAYAEYQYFLHNKKPYISRGLYRSWTRYYSEYYPYSAAKCFKDVKVAWFENSLQVDHDTSKHQMFVAQFKKTISSKLRRETNIPSPILRNLKVILDIGYNE